MKGNWFLRQWSERILGIQKSLKEEYDTVDTQVVDTTLQIFPMYSIATICKMGVSTGIFVLSVHTKGGTLSGMFDQNGVFQRDKNGDFTESGWMDILVRVNTFHIKLKL